MTSLPSDTDKFKGSTVSQTRDQVTDSDTNQFGSKGQNDTITSISDTMNEIVRTSYHTPMNHTMSYLSLIQKITH